MPPKAKFSREKIVETALDIVRTKGLPNLTARSLGEKLGSSPRPIFTVFQSMEEVRQAVTEAAEALYGEYVEKGLAEKHAFKGVGTQYILFSIKEPKLFQLLFMTEKEDIPDLSAVLPSIENHYEKILASIGEEYQTEDALAEKLYRHLWIYTHGIAALCATKTCRFTEGEIGEMISEVCVSLLKKMKAGKEND